MILAIESSCDETAVAVVNQGQILANKLYSQIRFHAKHGGVVPELASRLHAQSIDFVLNEALDEAGIELSDITSIAVTVGPGLEGALLVGITAANMLSKLLSVPIIPVNHLHGHICSARVVSELTFPLLACVASGGHTLLVHMSDASSYEVIANTMDDACGECFDKVARMLGLSYPGGPHIEKEAKNGKQSISFPHPVKREPNKFSFSGLKTAVYDMVRSVDDVPVADICASFQGHVGDVLAHKISLALDATQSQQLILCGGVFSNQSIRERVHDACGHVDIVVPDKQLCTDNAAMIGLAAELYLKLGIQPIDYASVDTRLGMSFSKDVVWS